MDGIYNTPQVSQAQQASTQASNTASQAAQSAMTLPDMLKDALSKKMGADNPAYQQRESALGNYFKTSTQAPLDYTAKSAGGNSDVVYNPLQLSQLINNRRTSTLLPITSLNDILGAESGGLDNIIGSTSRAAQAQVAGLQDNAQQAHQHYADIIDLISRQADENYRQEQLAKSGSGQTDLMSELALLLGMSGSGANNDNFWEQDSNPHPPAPTKKAAPAAKPVDLRGLNLSIGGGTGMGNIPLPASTPKKAAPKKESLPTFQTWNQLMGM